MEEGEREREARWEELIGSIPEASSSASNLLFIGFVPSKRGGFNGSEKEGRGDSSRVVKGKKIEGRKLAGHLKDGCPPIPG